MSGNSDSSGLNYWLVLSGLFGGYWAFTELTYSGGDYITRLKRSILHPPSLSKSNNGKLIFISGKLHSSDAASLQDPTFKISAPGLKLRRHVEMFQFFQASDKSIQSNWFSNPIDASAFPENYKNPKWRFEKLEIVNPGQLMVDDYKISSVVLEKLKGWREVLGFYNGNEYKQEEIQGKIVLHKSKKKFLRPRVGNYRVSHEYLPNGIYVSVIGQQRSDKIVPYGRLFIVKEGLVSADDMLDEYARTQNRKIWVTRLLCGTGFFFGLYMTAKQS